MLSHLHGLQHSTSSIGVAVPRTVVRIGIPKMLAKTIRECTENWKGSGRARPEPGKKARSLIIRCFSKRKDPGDGVGMILGSTGQVSSSSSSSEEFAVARAGASQRNPKTACPKMLASFSDLFDKRSALNYIKSRIRKAEGSRIRDHADRVIQGAKVKARRMGSAYDLIRRGNGPRRASRASTRARTNGKKTRMLGQATEEARGRHGKEETEGLELCKKRILMGSKCKPLNASGVLRYDENGILVPEELSP